MADFPMLLGDEKSSHMSTLFPTIALLLQIDTSVSFMMSLFSTIRYFIYTFRKVIVLSTVIYPLPFTFLTGALSLEEHQLLWGSDL